MPGKEHLLLCSYGGSIGPEKKEWIEYHQKKITTQKTKAAIYKVISQIIWVPHHLINALITEDNISYQYSLGDKVQEAAETKQSKCETYFGIAYRE
jgi:hypothetical protein